MKSKNQHRSWEGAKNERRYQDEQETETGWRRERCSLTKEACGTPAKGAAAAGARKTRSVLRRRRATGFAGEATENGGLLRTLEISKEDPIPELHHHDHPEKWGLTSDSITLTESVARPLPHLKSVVQRRFTQPLQKYTESLAFLDSFSSGFIAFISIPRSLPK